MHHGSSVENSFSYLISALLNEKKIIDCNMSIICEKNTKYSQVTRLKLGNRCTEADRQPTTGAANKKVKWKKKKEIGDDDNDDLKARDENSRREHRPTLGRARQRQWHRRPPCIPQWKNAKSQVHRQMEEQRDTNRQTGRSSKWKTIQSANERARSERAFSTPVS